MFFITYKNNILLGSIVIKKNRFIKELKPFSYQGILMSKEFDTYTNNRKISLSVELCLFFIEKITLFYNELAFSFHYEFKDLRPFQWHNWENHSDGLFKINLNYTSIIELKKYKNFEEYLHSIRKVRRQEYLKYIRDDFIIEESKDINLLNKLHKKTEKEVKKYFLIFWVHPKLLYHIYFYLKI